MYTVHMYSIILLKPLFIAKTIFNNKSSNPHLATSTSTYTCTCIKIMYMFMYVLLYLILHPINYTCTYIPLSLSPYSLL